MSQNEFISVKYISVPNTKDKLAQMENTVVYL